jgi:hypothetical protein
VLIDDNPQPVFTDADIGDYHRLLLPGTYDLTISTPGYRSETITGVVVGTGDATRRDVELWPQEVQSKDQQNCINELNKNGAKVAKAQGKENASCVKNAVKGRILSAEACLLEPKDKVERVKTKAGDKAAISCIPGEEPTIGATDVDTQNSVMVAKELDLIHDLFGPDLDVTIVVGDSDKARANCQVEVAKSTAKCQDTKLKEFNKCKKNGLRDESIWSGPDLETCMDVDPKGKIIKACETKLAQKLGQKCAGVGFATALPGRCSTAADPSDLAVCVGERVDCSVCLALNAVDNLGRDCDEFDDGSPNASCP